MSLPLGLSFNVPGYPAVTGAYSAPFNSLNKIESIQFSFDKYFQYQNSSGQAVYNESDGSQLKDPLS